MPGQLLHLGATVICAHSGPAQPTRTEPRVLISGMPTVTATAPYTVAGCTLLQPPGPCLTAQWVSTATRVRIGGLPALLSDGRAQCTPTGTPLSVLATQTRVKGI
ncbi:hypothetical protein ADL01_02300 [Streptomyces sp. NRRL WC-3618]|uniref:hypothetical protein n=1 Tax=Streptomyces sp. NRRL WC-3618 TaxID=1519490 RepID=UPI0006AE4D4D|nr:hypothetical protein [Streptomyces sp. NRRL WC-3618]KOV88198.1 hypothetical protein ADL01_02300 [Streptomyces sp. NRRL WC-3618]